MKTVKFLQVIVAFVVAVATGPSTADSGFTGTCSYPGATLSNTHLGLYCLNTDTQVWGYNYTWIDLNLCAGNDDGVLVGFSYGNYSNSCIQCSLSHDSTLRLNCFCLGLSGGLQSTNLDLDIVMGNSDGAATCFGHQGNRSLEGP